MKAHIGVDAESGLVHTVTTTAANAHDVTQAHALLHGQEEVVFADSGYRGVEKRQEVQDMHADVDWQIAMMPGKRKTLDKMRISNALRINLKSSRPASAQGWRIRFECSSVSLDTAKHVTGDWPRTPASCW